MNWAAWVFIRVPGQANLLRKLFLAVYPLNLTKPIVTVFQFLLSLVMRITITSIIHRILSNWKQWLPYLKSRLKWNFQHLDQHLGCKIWWNSALTWKGLKSCSKQTSPAKHISPTPNRRTISCIVVNVEITSTTCERRIFLPRNGRNWCCGSTLIDANIFYANIIPLVG